MRILLLSTYFQPDIASTGVLMTQLADELAKLGHKVTVITSMPHYDTNRIWDAYRRKLVQHERRGDIDVYRIWLYVPRRKESSLGRILNYGTFNLLSVLVAMATGKHDVVLVPSPPLTNGIGADVISRLWRVPFVYNVQDIWPDVVVRAGVMRNQQVIALFSRLERYVYRRARGLTVISVGFRDNLLRKGVPAEKISVIPNFFDTDFVVPLSKENSFSVQHSLETKFVVLFAGNVGHSQGLDTVLSAAKQLQGLKDVLFLIVGNGAAKQDLQTRAQQMELTNVRFMPFQPHDVLPEMYASADVCLVPLRRGFTNESVPCKVFTITASARPLVAAVDEGSDTWHFVQNAGCGICVEPEDPLALADAIRALYDNSALRAQLGQSGREYVVERYTPQAVGRAYDKLLCQLAS
jgi:colanic acid biosynthesis glycosyl transferase WcaI